MDKFPPSQRPRGSRLGRFGAIAFPLGCSALLFLSCIERSNPFDPINAGSLAADEIRQANMAGLEAKTALEAVFAADLAALHALFAKDLAANDSIGKSNARINTANDTLKNGNTAIKAANNSATTVESLRDLRYYHWQDNLQVYGPYADFQRRKDLQIQMDAVRNFMATVNQDHRPVLVYEKPFVDSVLGPYNRDLTAFDVLQSQVDNANNAVKTINSTISIYNADRSSENLAIKAYNDTLDFRRLSVSHPVITQADSLQSKTKTVQAGDTLLVGAGEFKGVLTFSNSGTKDNRIVIRGFPGMRTIIKAFNAGTGITAPNAVFLDGHFSSHFVFQDLVFRGGSESAFKIVGGSMGVTFIHCQFDSSGAYGLEVNDGSVDVSDSRILANGFGGIYFGGDQSKEYNLELRNNLIARNGGNGINSVSPEGDIYDCTIADNGANGIHVNSPLRNFSVNSSIITGNQGYGLFRVQDLGQVAQFETRSSAVWNNTLGDWGLGRPDSVWQETQRRHNLVEKDFPANDTEFVDAAGLDYSLRPGSKLSELERESPLFRMGYRP
ncbi:MAG: right-handed parallel beta-helix repeat-containing protein [Fibrobacteria bacterium]